MKTSSLQKNKISALLTAVIIFVSVVGVGIVYTPKILGLKAYTIETGSMAPTIPQGSMVYVRPCEDYSEYSVDDIATFTNLAGNESFTHRIVEIDESDMTFITKGDANADVDPSPTEIDYAVGKVEFAIPFLGYVSMFLRNTVVKIAVAVIYIAWAAIEIEVFLLERKKRDE